MESSNSNQHDRPIY